MIYLLDVDISDILDFLEESSLLKCVISPQLIADIRAKIEKIHSISCDPEDPDAEYAKKLSLEILKHITITISGSPSPTGITLSVNNKLLFLLYFL